MPNRREHLSVTKEEEQNNFWNRTDVCGPINPFTWDTKNYILTFLDDFTHCVIVYLLERKYEVAEKMKQFINMVEAKWELKISKLRSENGREYLSKDLTD